MASGETAAERDSISELVLVGRLGKTIRPPIATKSVKGESKTLNPLIDDLKKAGVFDEAVAKQLRAWAAIRNHAAHGEFEQFDRHQAAAMILGINSFLAEYMK